MSLHLKPLPPIPVPETRTALAVALVTLFTGALIAAFAVGDRQLTNTLGVGVLSALSTVVGFYFGSSKGSAAKDETIAALTKDGAP